MTESPVATKRVLRAFLNAGDVVAKDPARGARAVVDQGVKPGADYDTVLNDLRMMPYGVWRSHDPADTMRFYALRLKEAAGSTAHQTRS